MSYHLSTWLVYSDSSYCHFFPLKGNKQFVTNCTYPKDTEDTEAAQRSWCRVCYKTLQYGCLRPPLDPSNQDLTFWADSGPPGRWEHRGCAEVPLWSLSMAMDFPGAKQSRFNILSWLGTPRTLSKSWGLFTIFSINTHNTGVYGLPWTPAFSEKARYQYHLCKCNFFMFFSQRHFF